MSSTTPLPPSTDSTPEAADHYHLVNAALIAVWAVGAGLLIYAVASDDSDFYRYAALCAVMVPVSVRTVISLVRAARRRPLGDVAAIMEGSLVTSDERQRYLNAKAQALSGSIAMAALAVGGFFLCIAALGAHVVIDTKMDWLALAVATSYSLLMTQSIALIIVARHYSRKA